ncbi:MAG: DUF1156 domain-containing protein [Solirubrobacteraceae bacterium]
MSSRPRVLIEDWFPMTELGIESRREAAPIPGQFPKLKTLHVWWARRPLVVSAGAVLGSLMPTWSAELAAAFPHAAELASEPAYRRWFLRLCGVLGDPVAARAALDAAVASGVLIPNAYTYKPAFKNSPDTTSVRLLGDVLRRTWGDLPVVCDPTAGGGSIPYEAIRYGLPVHANDLNSVAAATLIAGLRIPAKHGKELAGELHETGNRFTSRMLARLERFFPSGADEQVATFVFARTVTCPRTGKLVPLSPNWWLSKGSNAVAVRLLTERDTKQLERCEFEIVAGRAIDFDPSRGTAAGGDAISPWDGLAIDADHIKTEARTGGMGAQLYAVVVRTATGRAFRAPTQADLDALDAAECELAALLPNWLAQDIVPDEKVPMGNDKRPQQYGMNRWRDMFSARQLLVHGTFVEEFHRLVPEVRAELGRERADAVLTLLALMQGKGLNYNSRQCIWDYTGRDKIAQTFSIHGFPFKYSYAEFEGARELMPWCLDQVVDAYSGIAELLQPSDAGSLSDDGSLAVPGKVTVTAGNAADLGHIDDRSVTLVCIDPPYYDNVMYAELSDFFYVWEKRTVGLIHPDLFATELTDKQNEAVANPARFADMGKRRKELANADYEAKMAAIFAEAARILRDDGVMTVMFTHKRAEAWDTLGMALMQAGFTIETSWPVNTESQSSLHQAKKNAAASTIMLVCRKREREVSEAHPYFEDLEGDVRVAARDAHARFRAAGIAGVDLLLATYGPALSVISSAWPVYSSQADPDTGRSRLLRPEEALDAARQEVVHLQRHRLVGAAVALDPLTDFTLIAWDTFRAAEFPFDEARRLALAVGGLDVDKLAHAKLLAKKSGTVQLLPPEKRVRRGDDTALPGVRPGSVTFGCVIDALHTVMYVADHDGLPAAKALLERAGLQSDAPFRACLQGLVNAIPRTRQKGEWVRPEAGTLDRICSLYFPDIELPPDPVVLTTGEQVELDLGG